jgi:hypothetical protein
MLKKLKRLYPALPHKYTLEDLCGMKDYGINLSAYKYIYAKNIYDHWREWHLKKKAAGMLREQRPKGAEPTPPKDMGKMKTPTGFYNVCEAKSMQHMSDNNSHRSSKSRLPPSENDEQF